MNMNTNLKNKKLNSEKNLSQKTDYGCKNIFNFYFFYCESDYCQFIIQLIQLDINQ